MYDFVWFCIVLDRGSLKKKRGQVMQSSFATYYSEKVYYNTMYSTEHRYKNDEIYDYDIVKFQQI